MKLSDCDARFWDTVGGRRGLGLLFECPLCVRAGLLPERRTLLPVAFQNPLDGGPPEPRPGIPHWLRRGDTLDSLSLTPSVDSSRAPGGKENPLHEGGHPGWHGYVENGEIRGGGI